MGPKPKPEEISYTYNGNTLTSYLGNYWDDYTGSDANGDGIGDTPYSIDGDKDNYPLLIPFENYTGLNQPPSQPTNISPRNGATEVTLTPTLESSSFSDPDPDDVHSASQWQVTATSGDYSTPVFDSGVDVQNLTQITVPSGLVTLEHDTTYYWRVRHQDNRNAWSEWSSETSFTTQPKILPVPYYYQGETEWCVPASMSMILNYYGKHNGRYIHSWDIAERWGWSRESVPITDEFWQVQRKRIRDYFSDHGLSADIFKVELLRPLSFYTIKDSIDQNMPVLLAMRSIKHAVVIVGYSLAGSSEKVYINDPSGELMLEFDPSVVGYLPYIAVKLDWNDVVEYANWAPFDAASYAIAVGGREPSPPKGTIDIYDDPVKHTGGVGFWREPAERRSQVYGWLYGLDKGLIWQHSEDHPLVLDSRDYFQFDRYIENHTEDDQTYGLEIEFASESGLSAAPIQLPVTVQRRNWAWNIMDPIPVEGLLPDYGEYTITLRLWDEQFIEQYDEVVFPSIEYKSLIEFALESPGNLYLTDPQGLHVGVDPSTGQVVNEIAGAAYTGPGSEPQVIAIPGRKIGDYLVNVIPDPDASPTDTYSLKVWADGMTIVLAEDVQIADIPSHPYIIESTETTIQVPITDVTSLVDIIKLHTRFDRRTGQLSFDASITNASSETLNSPVTLIIRTISAPSITVANADGTDENGDPYFDYSSSIAGDGQLSPGETSTARNIIFNNPNRLRFSFDMIVMAVLNSGGQAAPPLLGKGNFAITMTIPGQSALLQSYPNPFNPDTWIPYELAEPGDVTIRIYDVSGGLVRTLELGYKEIDVYTSREKAAYWDGRNEAGESAASGIYFYQIKAGDFVAAKKFVLLK